MTLKDLLDKAGKPNKKSSGKKTAKNIAIGAGIGSIVGLAAGVLFAPKSGKQTRDQLAKNAKNAAGTVKSGVLKAKEKISKKDSDDTSCDDKQQPEQEA